MNSEPEYKPFSTFVLRTPFFSVEEFSENIKKLNSNEDYWYSFLKSNILQEAIYLASPVLFEELHKFLEGKIGKAKDILKFKRAILKYYSRMSTRCTPFFVVRDLYSRTLLL